ncbi:MAG: sugar phosphate nucleotidyltransferase [Brevinema sp.]
MKILILAGGQGTRLWPLSRKTMPKQLLSPLNEDKPLVIQTAERVVAQGIDPKSISLVTIAQQVPLFKEVWKGFGDVIAEPDAKNTAPAILLGLKYLQKLGISDTEAVTVFPSDHYIGDFEFDTSIDASEAIFCYTLKPTRAETGYGYIQLEDDLSPKRKVHSFKEKPNLELAKEWFSAWEKNPSEPTNKFWNAGIFTFSINSLLAALHENDPELASRWQTSSYEEFEANYSSCPKVAFDVLVAEKASNLYALPLKCSKWRDIGTWESVHEALATESTSNVAAGEASITAVSSEGCLGFSKTSKLITFAGVENIAAIDTGDALLIVDKNNPIAMKSLLDKLASDHPEVC